MVMESALLLGDLCIGVVFNFTFFCLSLQVADAFAFGSNGRFTVGLERNR